MPYQFMENHIAIRNAKQAELKSIEYAKSSYKKEQQANMAKRNSSLDIFKKLY